MPKQSGLSLVVALMSIGLPGCASSSSEDQPPVLNDEVPFDVHWPPREPNNASEEPPLLQGDLSLFRDAQQPGEFELRITLSRPHGEADRLRWNKALAFPEHSWMAEVRVWDHDRQWLWPNLPFLLRGHGEEREERYGGVDPGKGVDNDFAAVLIRPLSEDPANADNVAGKRSIQPLVSAEWHSASHDKKSVVHSARSDTFQLRFQNTDDARGGALGVWLIYADFMGAKLPNSWPDDSEYAGGILAYFELRWQQSPDGQVSIQVEHLTPHTSTGFDWEHWSTDSPPLPSKLEMTLPSQE